MTATTYTGATIHTLAGDFQNSTLCLADGMITAIGTDPQAASGATVIDCSGLTIVPIADFSPLTPGSPATFAVIRTDIQKAWEYVLWRPENAIMFVVDGHRTPAAPPVHTTVSDSPHLGMWIDESGYLHQELTPGGRYDETRGGRPHAYQGDFWIIGDRIVYRDDLGFWAYGQFTAGTLHHAGYTLRKP